MYNTWLLPRLWTGWTSHNSGQQGMWRRRPRLGGVLMRKDTVQGLWYLGEFTASFLAFCLLAPFLPRELPLGFVGGLSVVFWARAIFRSASGLCEPRERSSRWNSAFWCALWGAELAAVAWIFAPAIRNFGVCRLGYFMTGFYLQANGATQLAGAWSTGKARAIRDLAIGLLGMAIAVAFRT
jgi:hypothetical protein